MISLLHVMSYAGALAAFLFVTLSLASGLLWLAELIEEHSKFAKVIGMRAIYVIIVLHVILIFTDSLPILPTLLSITAHLVYLTNFTPTWPFISLTSPKFIASCILVVADHFTWFFHFAAKAQEAKRFRGARYRYGSNGKNDEGPVFIDVAAFFAICVWAVPLFLFLSLSANDNALPSFGDASAPPSPSGRHIDLSTPGGTPVGPSHRQIRAQSSTSLVKSLLVPLVSLLPRLRSRRKNDEGLIAPRTPIRGSPVHSPIAMPQSYFPWDGNSPNLSSTNSPRLGSLNPDVARTMSRTPPPPRRVQSDAFVHGTGLNPRGIATRDGRPVFPDSGIAGEDITVDGVSKRLGLGGLGIGHVGTSSPGRSASSSARMESPSMSLGSSGAVGNAEIVDAGVTKRKND
ncbi:transmembrane adaptor Erv26-domain-containing protein [Kockovaella imperatae]|uniref:Transmembrane adaptor Erv26-domain-containing protein n=1 Tax=Kockovaella imperatae TaxID=4999 RepID=A0A1Y1UC39_9TREE|nr:transmembrane adaptor Erv26-domain-containing protein [Kockovaella imperatae]ORX35056.1 transmembrane adaptor Erv26-domain-containing protein [Kockovaella imperatae]